MIAILIGLTIWVASVNASATTIRDTSVRIYNLEKSGGGSGVIFKSFKTGSYILTNAHICSIVNTGGVVLLNSGDVLLITHFKLYKTHDLCLIRVGRDLKINTQLAKKIPIAGLNVKVSGHPNLLPHIVTKGSISDRMIITLNYRHGVLIYESVLLSNLIMPGSSGSAVFNSDNKIVGLVFAGETRGLSFGHSVPLESLRHFILNHRKYEWVEVIKHEKPVCVEIVKDKKFRFIMPYIALKGGKHGCRR